MSVAAARYLSDATERHQRKAERTRASWPAWIKKARFHVTLYLTAEEHIVLARKSALLNKGKVSMHKFLRAELGLENAENEVTLAELKKAVREMHSPPEETDEITARRLAKKRR